MVTEIPWLVEFALWCHENYFHKKYREKRSWAMCAIYDFFSISLGVYLLILVILDPFHFYFPLPLFQVDMKYNAAIVLRSGQSGLNTSFFCYYNDFTWSKAIKCPAVYTCTSKTRILAIINLCTSSDLLKYALIIQARQKT